MKTVIDMDNYPFSKIAVTATLSKKAALLFDYCLNLSFTDPKLGFILFETEEVKKNQLKMLDEAILFISKQSGYNNYLSQVQSYGAEKRANLYKNGKTNKYGDPIIPSDVERINLAYKLGSFIEEVNSDSLAFSSILNANGIAATSVITKIEDYSEEVPQNYTENIIEFSVFNMPVINFDILNWEQIFEVKKDYESFIKLKKFRTFAFNNYSGKPSSFIQDDILFRMYDYESVIKKHDLKTVNGAMKILLNSKSLLTFSALTICGIILGELDVRNISILLGSTIEVGKLALFLRERKCDKFYTKNENEIAFLMSMINNSAPALSGQTSSDKR